MALDIYGTEEAERMLRSVRSGMLGSLRIAYGVALDAGAQRDRTDRDLLLVLEGANICLIATSCYFGVEVEPITLHDLAAACSAAGQQSVRTPAPALISATIAALQEQEGKIKDFDLGRFLYTKTLHEQR